MNVRFCSSWFNFHWQFLDERSIVERMLEIEFDIFVTTETVETPGSVIPEMTS